MGTNYNPKIVTDGLVLCLDAANIKSYPGSGTVFTDLSGSNRTTTLTNGPAFSADNSGVLVFDGVNDYLNFPSTSPMSGTNLYTFEIWINITSVSGSWGTYKAATLFAGGTSSGGGQPEFVILNDGTSATTPYYLSLGRGGGGTTGTLSLTISSLISNGSWYQIVLTRTGSSSQVVYLNGSQIGTGTVSNSFSDGQTDIGALHGNLAGYTGFLNGKISNVRIYNRALTGDEVFQNFNATRGRFGI